MENIVLIIGIVLAVFGGISLVLPWLAKKGANVPGFLSGTATVLQTAGTAVEGLYGLTANPAFALGGKIIDYAKQAVSAAEQLYKTSQIEADGRKQAATELVYEFIALTNEDITEDVKKVVNGCIEAAVWALPKTNENLEKA